MASPRTWLVPKQVLQETATALAGGQHEIFALWTARRERVLPDCEVSRLVIPAQTPETSAWGVSVLIEGDELARIVYDNYERGEKSVIQLHTHPSRDVRMSLLDRDREVVRHVGGLSIIVPWYARDGLEDFPGVNVYEREDADWRLWSATEVKQRIVVR